jgi:hypothetical protein
MSSSEKVEMGMHTWQALVLLRSEYRTARVDRPHVQNEALDHFALGTIAGAERRRIEEHTHACNACRHRLKEARAFAQLLSQMDQSPVRSSIEECRKEPRYEITEPATITVFHPVESTEIHGLVVNISRSGCRVRTSEPICSGADVLIVVKSAAVFATIRYCRANPEGTFDMGLRIGQVVMGQDSSAAMESLKSQVEASGWEEQDLANAGFAHQS